MSKNNSVAKLVPGFLFLFVMASNGFAQTTEASIDDLPVKPINLPALSEVGGSPFFSADYILAAVHIKNDVTVTDIPVKFNIYNNAMMVRKDGQDMKLASFDMVSYDEKAADGKVKNFKFRQGYPAIDNHSEQSIYQVVSMGPRVHLLKYLSQKVEDAATLGDYSRREIVTTEQLYIYVPGGEIKRIKPSKQAIVDALPALSAKIDEIANANNLKLKSEAEIAFLVDALNKP